MGNLGRTHIQYLKVDELGLVNGLPHLQKGTIKMSFTPSKYQLAIFNWISQGRGDGIVNAVAGAGKTTTLVMGAAQLSSTNSLFCVIIVAKKKQKNEDQNRLRAKRIYKNKRLFGISLGYMQLKKILIPHIVVDSD